MKIFGLAASVAGWSSDSFFDGIKIPRKTFVEQVLLQNEYEFVGNHWTDFSNNYGGCEVGLANGEQPGPEPKNRFQPLLQSEECFAPKCMVPLRSNRRYKVCTLPDHPKVKTPSNYPDKFMATTNGNVNKDGKMKRYDH